MKAVKARITIISKTLYNLIETNKIIRFISSVNKSIDTYDHDENVKKCCQEVDLDKQRIIDFSDKSVNIFHQRIVEQIENNDGIKFLIFKN